MRSRSTAPGSSGQSLFRVIPAAPRGILPPVGLGRCLSPLRLASPAAALGFKAPRTMWAERQSRETPPGLNRRLL